MMEHRAIRLAPTLLAVVLLGLCVQCGEREEKGNWLDGVEPTDHMSRWGVPETIKALSEHGREAFGAGGLRRTTIRLDQPGKLSPLQEGSPIDNARAATLDLNSLAVTFEKDCRAWGERRECMLWQIDADVLREAQRQGVFGGLAIGLDARDSGVLQFHVSFPGVEGFPLITTVPLIPGDRATYTIRPDAGVLPDNSALLDPRRISLAFPGVSDEDEVTVSSLAVITKVASYADRSTGFDYETLDGELRPVFFQWSGGASTWTGVIPEGRPVLKLGLGLPPGSSAVTFTVEINVDGKREELLVEPLSFSDRWSDRLVPLGEWRGRRATLTFRVSGETQGVGLWSSPRIVQSDQEGRLAVLYVIDALRPDFCEGFGDFHGRITTTPGIRRLAAEGVSFRYALANAPLTKYSMPALFSGLLPRHTGIMTHQTVPASIETLAERLREAGFRTLSFSNNSNSGQLRGLHQGFDRTFSVGRMLREQEARSGRRVPRVERRSGSSDALINELLFDVLRGDKEEDTFLFIHVVDPHMPYVPNDEYLSDFHDLLDEIGYPHPESRKDLLEQVLGWSEAAGAERLPEAAIVELYRGAVRTADKHLLRLVEFLEAEDLFRKATIVLTADHGEHLTEHPEAGRFIHMHPMLLEVLRVPLILVSPTVPRGVTSATPVQLADVMPTLLDLAGVSYDSLELDGVSLLSVLSGADSGYFSSRPIISQSAPYWSVVVEGLHSPDVAGRALGGVQIYDVGMDPREHAALRGRAAQKGMERLVGALALAASRPIPAPKGRRVLEAEALRELRELGYVD